MVFSLKHKFQSLKSDGGDATKVQPSNWNDEHDLIMSGPGLIGRSAAGSGTASELDINDYRIPPGVMVAYGNATAPSRWSNCDGTTLSRVTEVDLFTAIGTSYGAGDGTTTFNKPDLRGRVPIGLDPTGTRVTNSSMAPNGNTLGATGGAQLHAHSVSVSGTAFTNGLGGTAFTHGMFTFGPTETQTYSGGGNTAAGPNHSHQINGHASIQVSGNASVSASGTTANAVSLPPALMVNWIIKL